MKIVTNLHLHIKDRKILFILVFGLKFALEICYRFGVSQVYKGLLDWNPNNRSFFVSLVLTFFIAVTLPKNVNSASHFFCLLFDSLSVLPILCYFWMNDQSMMFVIFVTMMDCIIHIVAGGEGKFDLVIRWSSERKISNFFIQALFVFYVVSSIYLVLRSSGPDNRAFKFHTSNEIYKLRSEVSFGRFSGYLYNWVTKPFFQFFMGIGLHKKSKVIVIGAVLSQFLMFMCYGNKIAFFSIFFVFGIYFVIKSKKSVGIIIILAEILVFVLIPFFMNISFLNGIGQIMNGQIGMRTAFIPAYIQNEYYTFFQNKEYLHFSEGLIGKILGIPYPFPRAIGIEISNYFLGEGNAGNHNAGIIADAYANAGVIGMVLIGMLCGMCLRLIDRLSWKIPPEIKVIFIGLYAVHMGNNGFLTTFLTNGLFILIILVSVYNNACEMKKDREGSILDG